MRIITMSDQPLKMFAIKADENLLKSFKQVCKDNDRSASQVVRDLMRAYIKKNRQGNLLL